jgi:hypothetical protein
MRERYNFDIVVSLPFFQAVLNFVYLGIGTAVVSFLRKYQQILYISSILNSSYRSALCATNLVINHQCNFLIIIGNDYEIRRT